MSFEEAQTAFLDEEALVIEDPDHSEAEDRFILLGVSCGESGSLIRIVSARRAGRHEQEQYRERLRR